MALELARQLSQMGREVEVVVLIEPISLNARPAFRCILCMLDTLFTVIPGKRARLKLRAAAMYQFWRTFRWLCEHFGLASPSEDDSATWADEPKATKKIYQRLMANYTPSPIPARIVCLTAEGSSRAVEFDWKPWRRLSPAVTAFTIPGTHMSCLTTHVGRLAESLKAALASPTGESHAV